MEFITTKIRKKFKLLPKVSIIIPFYNSQEYINNCLDTIIKGTHISYEIICVDDGSTDDTSLIVKNYSKCNKNIRLISLKENKGLYFARLIGVRYSRGEYIGFVDSDDYVSDGYFDHLLCEIEKNGADISVAKVVNVDLNGCKYIQTRCSRFPYASENADTINKSIYYLYWEQSGRCYHWHVVWNKLYRRKLWENMFSILKQQKQHLIMMEDFIYSSLILSQVTKYVVANEANYYYVAHANTSIQNEKFIKIKKNIIDMSNAFEFVEKYLISKREFLCYRKYLEKWKQRYGRYWRRNIMCSKLLLEEKDICIHMLEDMTGNVVGEIMPEDDYYYELADIIN